MAPLGADPAGPPRRLTRTRRERRMPSRRRRSGRARNQRVPDRVQGHPRAPGDRVGRVGVPAGVLPAADREGDRPGRGPVHARAARRRDASSTGSCGSPARRSSRAASSIGTTCRRTGGSPTSSGARSGTAITAGAIAALVALGIGMLRDRADLERTLAVGAQIAQAGDQAPPELIQELGALQAKGRTPGQVELRVGDALGVRDVDRPVLVGSTVRPVVGSSP